MVGGCFSHLLLPYECAGTFLAGTVPFVLDGLAAGDAVVVVTGVANHELLRLELGEAAEGVRFLEAEEWYGHPARTLARCLAEADEVAREGGRLRLVGEPVWKGLTDRQVREWQRIEAAVNVAFAGSDAAVMCPYNRRSLPAGIVAQARRTHPWTVRGATPMDNPGYLEPRAARALFDDGPPAPAPANAESLPISVLDLYWLRVYVADFARGSGLAEGDLPGLLVAVTEVVTNALRHGAPPVRLTLWTEPGELVCEVTDGGAWTAPAGYSYLPPEGSARFGLWAVRLLCSAVQIHARGAGTTVRLRMPVNCGVTA